MVFFMPENRVRVTVRVTFRVTKRGLQKRNVLDSVTFRVTHLTLLQVVSCGKRVWNGQKNGSFSRIQGAKYIEKERFRGAKFTKKCLFIRVCENWREIWMRFSFRRNVQWSQGLQRREWSVRWETPVRRSPDWWGHTGAHRSRNHDAGSWWCG